MLATEKAKQIRGRVEGARVKRCHTPLPPNGSSEVVPRGRDGSPGGCARLLVAVAPYRRTAQGHDSTARGPCVCWCCLLEALMCVATAPRFMMACLSPLSVFSCQP